MRPRISKAGPTEAGYTYVSVLAILAVMAIAAQTTFVPEKSARIRAMEEETLFRGLSYLDAIRSYQSLDGAAPALPAQLEHLLLDPRAEGVRHIRRLYDDPTSRGAWRIVRDEANLIVGVAPRGDGRPRRQAFFPPVIEHFAGAERYADWEFTIETAEE